MRKITIHRALSELKTLDARIKSAIAVLDPIGIRQEGKPIATAVGRVQSDAGKFATDAKSDLDSIQKLIANKGALKRAIVDSNAKTKVKIADKEMTVAEAITEKAFVALREELLGTLIARRQKAEAAFNVMNEKVEKNKQVLLENMFGKDQTKVSADDIKNVTEPFEKNNRFSLVDPLELNKLITDMGNEISAFKTDVDAVLSETNATTFIEIE